MGDKELIQDNVESLKRVAKRFRTIQFGPPREDDNGRPAPGMAPVYPHLSKPKHTTSYVSYVSVPAELAAKYSAAVAYLSELYPGMGANTAIIQAVLHEAQALGWEQGNI